MNIKIIPTIIYNNFLKIEDKHYIELINVDTYNNILLLKNASNVNTAPLQHIRTGDITKSNNVVNI